MHRLACAAALSLAVATPVDAQGWLNDRTNNSIINSDQISARFRDQIAGEIERIGRRPAPVPAPTAGELRAVRDADRWWAPRVINRSADEPGTPTRVGLAFLYDSALINSAQIRVFGDLPAIRDTLEQEVRGRYTPRGFVDGVSEVINDPTRSLAVTRGNERLVSRQQALEGGVRQRLVTGGEVTVGQRFFNINTNSTDFQPGTQSRSRAFVTVVQPLLRDSGTAYTRSLHEVARIDARIAQSEFRRQVDGHLLDIARAYWGLHLARAAHVQRERGAQRARALVGQLEGRTELDADPLLISRARVALSLREADLLRSRSAIRNSEARIRGLVNDPRFEVVGAGELLPVDMPLAQHETIQLQTVLERAVALRPEVQQLFLQHRAAVLREGQAQIEALPRADLILEGNFGGRALDTWQWGPAFNNMSNNTQRPGGLVGLRIEVPLGADDLRARLDRRRLETRQVESQGRATIATIIAEAEITLNEYNVAYRELAARAGALRATARDLGIETERWQQGVAGSRGENAANALERLLSAQDRLVEAEERFVTSQATFTLAFLALQRVQGTFTSFENLQMQRLDDAARGPNYVFRRNTPTEGRPSPTPTSGPGR